MNLNPRLVLHGLHGGPVFLAGDAAAVELVVRAEDSPSLCPRLGGEHEPVVLADLLSWCSEYEVKMMRKESIEVGSHTTGRMGCMAHRKWKESKQQLCLAAA